MTGSDSLYSLLIRVEGGDAAAAEIIKSQYALKQVEVESDGLKGKFQEGFQHLALVGFVADAGRAAGLGREVLPIISMMNMGISEAGAALGIAGGPLTMFVTGLTALAGIAYLVHNHMQEHGADLKSVMAGYKENVSAIDDYVAAGGRLSAALKREAQDTRDALAETLKKITADTAASLTEAQHTLTLAQSTEAYAKRSAARNNDTVGLAATHAATVAAQKAVTDLQSTLEANQHGFATWQEYVKGSTKNLQDLTKAGEDSQKWLDKWSEDMGKEADKEIADDARVTAAKLKQYDEVQAGLAKLKEVTTTLRDQELQSTLDTEAKKKAAIDQFRDQHLNAINLEYAKLIDAAHGNAAEIVRIEQAKTAAVSQLSATVAARQRMDYSQIQLAAGQAYDSITTGASQAAAAAVVSGGSAHDKIIALTKSVEEQVVASLIRIAVQATITKEAVEAVFVAA